jgi:LysM repeat protein/lysophospholipase L1-like esterase
MMRIQGWFTAMLLSFSGIVTGQPVDDAHQTASNAIPSIKSLSFLDTTVNLFQSHQTSLIGSFVEQTGLLNTPGFSVLHLGDEMVCDIAEPLGNQLFGKTRGPGLFFPGSLINHALTSGVETRQTGFWTYATPSENQRLLSAGVTGYSAKTDDVKSTLSIVIPSKQAKYIDQLVLYCERSEQHFDVVVSYLGMRKADGSAQTLSKREFPASISYRNSPVIEFPVPAGTKEILIQFKQVISTQKSFVLHGVSLLNSKQGQLHSVGLRGCGYNQLLRLELLKQQLIQLAPNIVLLDFGMHDGYRTNESQDLNLEPMRRCIQLIKEAVPSTKIIVVIPQDVIRGGRTLTSFSQFEKSAIALCKSEKVIYYDWYRVSGGQYSAQYWADFQLFSTDGMHLEESGNNLKAQLYASAWQNTTKRYNQGYRQFVIPEDSSKRLAFRTRDTLSKNIVVSEVWRYHVVRRGETAYRIAMRYGITVAQLKEWNHLRNYNIAAGTRLKVGKLSIATKTDPIQTMEPKDSSEIESTPIPQSVTLPTNSKDSSLLTNSNKPNSNNTPKPTPSVSKPKVVYHKVKAGETLYSISRTYGISVDDVKRMNGLRSNNILVGRLLRVQ